MVNTNAQSTTEVIDVVMPMFMMMIMFGMMKNIMPKSAPSKEHSQVEHLSQLYPKTGDEPPSALEVHPNRDYIWTQDGCTTGYILDTMMHQLKGGIQGPTEILHIADVVYLSNFDVKSGTCH